MNKNEMLDLLFENRVNDIATLTPSEHEIMKKSVKAREKFIKIIDAKISSDSIKSDLIDALDELDESFGCELAALSEKYYKAGFQDAIKLVLGDKENKEEI